MSLCWLRRSGLMVGGYGLLLPLLMGQGCPSVTVPGGSWGPGGAWTNTDGYVNGAYGTGPALLVQTFSAVPFTGTFTPTVAGRTINVVVTGNQPGSRPTFSVTDSGGAVVAEVTSPSSNAASANFVATSTDSLTVTVNEAGTPASSYSIRVMEPYMGGMMGGWMNGMMQGWGY